MGGNESRRVVVDDDDDDDSMIFTVLVICGVQYTHRYGYGETERKCGEKVSVYTCII